MELFDYVKVIFDSKPKYEDLSLYDKVKNSYMLNRFMSIRYPIQANLFNTLGTNSLGAADSWRRVTVQFKRTPGWIFTKVKKSQTKQKESFVPSDETISFFMKINDIGQREYQECLKYNKDKTISYLKILEKEIKSNVS